ncbi:hypothetical protein AUK40_05135 [Candidatus Wirthbacteria bacterium CG2_30_54_11]|uniref:Fibronectin type-III domain-containing protein n=1 Tax=Candidatus Wirthbacteria bacterium CG2_30_54_11 TaxID=1817892 RepID=A0A1J5IGU0_9BACT|nr:MAG: hypothetical protein AUK40_05135 [Candidatus Wirthbacteria bacterium CG2_30_54_11]
MPNKMLKITLAAVAVCLLPVFAHAETQVVLVATDDASVTSTAADQPNGNAESLVLEYKAGENNRQSITYLSFDLSSIPKNAVVTRARLTLFASSVSELSETVIQLKDVQDSWTQSTLTWNTKKETGITRAAATIHASDSGEFITWPDNPTLSLTDDKLTAQINLYVRSSVDQFSCALVGPAPEVSPDYTLTFVSTEDGTEPDRQPRLVVTYDQPGPKISGVTATDITDTAVTISWVTDEVADSLVRYGESPSVESSQGSSATTTQHSVKLTSLKPRSDYNFRVESTDKNGALTSSDLQTFTTIATPPPTNDVEKTAAEVPDPKAADTTATDPARQPATQKTTQQPISTPATTAPRNQSGELLLSESDTDTTPKKNAIDAVKKWAVTFLPFIAIIGFFILIFRSSISGYAETNTPGFKPPVPQDPQFRAPAPPPMQAPPQKQPPPEAPACYDYPTPPMPAPQQPVQPPPTQQQRPMSTQPPRPQVVRLTPPQLKNRPPVLDLKKKQN